MVTEKNQIIHHLGKTPDFLLTHYFYDCLWEVVDYINL